MSSDSRHAIKSPVDGTFYRSPNPVTDPFVRVGDSVEEGQLLCLIDAMMGEMRVEVEADRAGLIREILVEDGQAVTYGQSLFIVA